MGTESCGEVDGGFGVERAVMVSVRSFLRDSAVLWSEVVILVEGNCG